MKFADPKFVSDPGTKFHKLYAPKVGKDGVIDLVESGVEDTDALIQSYAESTDLNVILSRVANGETELLHQRNGIFGDFTGMPKTYAEALQLHIDSNRLFASLPDEVRKKFDYDENKFFATAGENDWFENVKSVMPADIQAMYDKRIEKPVEPIEKETKE